MGTAAIGARLDGIEAGIGDLQQRLTHLERMLVGNAIEVEALRQQVDECRDFLEVQHDAVRDALQHPESTPRGAPPVTGDS